LTVRKSKHRNSRFTAWLLNHLQVTLASLGRLYRQPIATLMTVAVIAIALTLPTSLYVAINNLSHLGAHWDSSTQISAFLFPRVKKPQAQALAARLRLDKAIRSVKLIDKKTGLAEFKKASGFKDALKFLDTNPLPIVLLFNPILTQRKRSKSLSCYSVCKMRIRLNWRNSIYNG